jgi:hypothetical protein
LIITIKMSVESGGGGGGGGGSSGDDRKGETRRYIYIHTYIWEEH